MKETTFRKLWKGKWYDLLSWRRTKASCWSFTGYNNTTWHQLQAPNGVLKGARHISFPSTRLEWNWGGRWSMIEKIRREIHESWSSEEVFLATAEEMRELKYIECLLLPRHVTQSFSFFSLKRSYFSYLIATSFYKWGHKVSEESNDFPEVIVITCEHAGIQT